MHKTIEKELEKEDFKSEDDLNRFIDRIRNLISEYEHDLYDKGTYTKNNQILVKKWRSQLYKLSQKRDSLVTQNDIPDVLESTVNILNRQISKIDSNTALLNRGTLKLMGLDYTNNDIDKELVQTKNKIVQCKNNEQREIRMMYISMFLFCTVCFFVMIDKFILKL
jgi:hypothetical protein